MIPARFRESHLPHVEPLKIIIDPDRCNGCGFCLNECGGKLFEITDGKARFVGHPFLGESCVGCRNCMTVCPKDAIQITGYYTVPEGWFKTFHQQPKPGCGWPNPFGENQPPSFESIAEKLTETEKIAYRRRSNRIFKKRQVPRTLIERVFEAGRFAPSAGNCQPWRPIVLRNREIIKKVEAECTPILKIFPWLYLGRSGWRRYVMPLLSLAFPHLFDQRSIGGMDIITHRNGAEIFLGAPTVILIFGDVRGIGNVDLDCGIYAHQLVMVAHSLGLGTCYIGFSTPVNLLPGLKKELGVEWPFIKLVTAIAIGYPAVKVDGPVEREIPKVIWHE